MNDSTIVSSLQLAFWRAAEKQLAEGTPVFVALVAHHTAHSPGTARAKMLVTADGSSTGTIGGGIMEADVVRMGRQWAVDGTARIEAHTLLHRKTGLGEKSGMICAGSQTNLYACWRPDQHLSLVRLAIDCFEADGPAILHLSPDNAQIELPTGGGELEHTSFEGTDSDWRYREQLLNTRRLAIMGGGHCSLALCRVMQMMGYAITVFDTRPGVSTIEANKFAARIIITDHYSDRMAELPYPELTPVIVMTSAAGTDVEAVRAVHPLPVPWIGIMGSEAKIAVIRNQLDETSGTPIDTSRLRAPVGITIPSRTPEEIAISIAGQIIAEAAQENYSGRMEFTSPATLT
ncbi:MAG: XdhC family protein [Candidatus Marinimicrobia bacterium]|nr:XdhC family protein [Candidatus Neomarinimicrobiota bacterium]